MFEEHHWLDATFQKKKINKYQGPFWLEKKNTILHIYYFQFSERGFMAVCCAGNRKVRMGGAPGIPSQTPWKSADITRRCFLRGMSARPNGSINQTQSAVSHTFAHTHTHTHTHTHSQQQGGTIPPTALSPHLFLPDISIMKCTVIYVSSDSAGPRNEVLVSCMDLQTDHQASNTGTDTLQWLLPFSYLS